MFLEASMAVQGIPALDNNGTVPHHPQNTTYEKVSNNLVEIGQGASDCAVCRSSKLFSTSGVYSKA